MGDGGRFLFALVSPRWPCVKLSCNKGLCASGCFFVVTTSFTLAGLYSLALKVDVLPLPRPAHWAADVVKGRPLKKKKKISRSTGPAPIELEGFGLGVPDNVGFGV